MRYAFTGIGILILLATGSVAQTASAILPTTIPALRKAVLTADSSEVRKPKAFRCDLYARNGRKIWRAEIISFTYQAIGYAWLAALPEESSGWDLSKAKEHYKLAYTKPPVWDPDSWIYNYLGHPLTGALHYNALRSQHVPAVYSFLYSSMQSVIWEYLWEASAERPSRQDLLITSTAGSVIGEFFHWSTLKMQEGRYRTIEKIVVLFINPSYVLNNGFKQREFPYHFHK